MNEKEDFWEALTLHREVFEDGHIRWFNADNQLHRVDGPAVEYPDGTNRWYLNGNLHRVDGPAIEFADGTDHWYLNGKQHREDGPAVENADGSKYWFLNDKMHRVDTPAFEYIRAGAIVVAPVILFVLLLLLQ